MLSDERKREIEEEEKHRNSVRNKKSSKKTCGCLTLFALLVIIVVIWSFSGSSNTNTKITSKSSLENDSTGNSNRNTSVAETVKSYQLGQSFTYSGDFLNKKYNWLVTKSESNKLSTFKKTCGLKNETFTPQNGVFYIVTIEGENKANEEFDIDSTITSQLILVSKDGKKYSQNNVDMSSSYKVCTLPDYPLSSSSNPGARAKSVAVFDVPEQEYKACDQYMKNVCIEGIK